MPLTTAGRDFIRNAVHGNSSPVLFTAANTRLGVGYGTAAFAAAQTNLQGASTFRKLISTIDFTQGSNIVRLIASFAPAEANFAWEEWGVFNDASAGTMLSRRVESLGTKANTAQWDLTVDLAYNNA